MIGFIRHVSLSIDKIENKDERPFAIRAFMAAELFKRFMYFYDYM